jgi:hypothetical protein
LLLQGPASKEAHPQDKSIIAHAAGARGRRPQSSRAWCSGGDAGPESRRFEGARGDHRSASMLAARERVCGRGPFPPDRVA